MFPQQRESEISYTKFRWKAKIDFHLMCTFGTGMRFNQKFEWNKSRSILQVPRNKLYISDAQNRNYSRSNSITYRIDHLSHLQKGEMEKWTELMKCQVEAIRFYDKSRLTFHSIPLLLYRKYTWLELSFPIVRPNEWMSERGEEENSTWKNNIIANRRRWRVKSEELFFTRKAKVKNTSSAHVERSGRWWNIFTSLTAFQNLSRQNEILMVCLIT